MAMPVSSTCESATLELVHTAYVPQQSRGAAHLCDCNQADTQTVLSLKLGVLRFCQLWLSLICLFI